MKNVTDSLILQQRFKLDGLEARNLCSPVFDQLVHNALLEWCIASEILTE